MMSRPHRILPLLAWLLLSATIVRPQALHTPPIPGDLLLMLTPDGSPEKVANDLRLLNGSNTGIEIVREVSRPMRTWKFRFDHRLVDQYDILRAARRHPDVALAQHNHRLQPRNIPDDTQYGEQWHHQNIDSESAWAISTGGLTADGDTIVVCIIENADLPHEDLIGNAWFNHQEIPDNGVDDDDNGYVDDFRGWNPNSGTDEVYGGGHGTEVAGFIGAQGNNSLGVVGANWSVKMMVVFNSGSDDEGVIASHSYPLTMRRLYNQTNGQRGAFVVATNASWGINGGQPSDAPLWCAMYDSLGAQGVLNCGATANNAVDVDVVGDLPTACPSEYMISVTATDVNDVRNFSAFGLNTIDVGAPGDDVLTTNINDTYGTASGTSFACPLTAGVIGLLYSAPCPGLMTLVKGDPAAGAMHIREMLFQGVDQVGNLPGNTVTGGRINAGTSMELIMASCGPCPAPYNLGVQTVDINSSLLTWSAVNGTTFDLRYRIVGAPAWTEVPGLVEAGYAISGISACTPYEFQVRVNCEEGPSDHSALFTFTSEGCCVAPTGLSQGFVGENIVNIFWQEVLAASSYDVRYAPITSSDFTIVVGVTNPFLELTPLEPCRNYTVQVRAACEDAEITEWCDPIIVGTSGCGACTDNPYCATEGGDSSGEWIGRVTLGAIDNESGSDDGYGNYTDLSTELMVGATHPIRLEPGYSQITFSEWFRVWMDLDQDGTFNDDSELVFESDDASDDPVEGDLFLPWDATLGSTRMRVGMRFQSALNSACTPSFNYGEVEDYCITLLPNPEQGLPGTAPEAPYSIHPIPADEQVIFRALTEPVGAVLHLFDTAGRTLLRQALQQNTVVRTASLAAGAYGYRISTADGREWSGRLVVTH